jgi:hypothetical protein
MGCRTVQTPQRILAMLFRIYFALFLASISMRSASLSLVEPASAAKLGRSPDSPASGSRAGSYALHGVVVDSATNEPVPHALVTLNFEGQRFAFAGADGTFQFEGLTYSGQGAIDAKKPGYFSPQDVRTSQRSTSHTSRPVTVGPDQPPVVLKLIPEGVISVRVSGEGGEPIDSLPVHLLFESVENGRRVTQQLRSLQTDEAGEFRAAELVAGRYFVFVGPDRASIAPETGGRGRQGYPAVFYAGASDLASASPIELTPGQHAEINISLSLRPFFRIAGTIGGVPSGDRVNLEVLDSGGVPVGTSPAIGLNKGTFEMEPLPSGSYTITAQDLQQVLSASLPLHLNSDALDVPLTPVPGIAIPWTVRLELTHSDTQTDGQGPSRTDRGNTPIPFGLVRITFSPSNWLLTPQRRFQPALTGSGDSFVMEHVPPGVYAVHLDPTGPYYVQSARSGATDLLREEFTVAPGASVQPIQVVLRNDFASLVGKVSYDAGVESAIVLVIPEDNPAGAVQKVVSQPGGVFDLRLLAPGAYKVLAVNQVDNFPYAEPGVLEKYLSKAHDLTLGPDQAANVELELVHVEQ